MNIEVEKMNIEVQESTWLEDIEKRQEKIRRQVVKLFWDAYSKGAAMGMWHKPKVKPEVGTRAYLVFSGEYSGKHGKVLFDHADLVADYTSDGWVIDGYEEMENIVVHAWMHLPPVDLELFRIWGD